MNNYITPLDIPTGKIGEWEVKKDIIPAGTPAMLNNTRNFIYGQKRAGKVVYDVDTYRHQLLENGSRWMSDWPVEIAQTQDCLKGMRGHILIGGLGLGLAITLLATRKTVRSITVIELQQEVIDLVAPHTTTGTTGVTYIHDDLLKNLKEFEGGRKYDYAFYDIWASDGEGTFHETVVPLLELSKNIVKHRPVCWNEDIMRGQLRMGLSSRLLLLQHPEMRPTNWRNPWEEYPEAGPYWQWAVPFWQWYKEAKPNQKEFDLTANLYSCIYGTWNWQDIWSGLPSRH